MSKRIKTLKAFKNYASENCLSYWECNEKDIMRAWKYYNSETGKIDNLSVNYCIDVSLEVNNLI